MPDDTEDNGLTVKFEDLHLRKLELRTVYNRGGKPALTCRHSRISIVADLKSVQCDECLELLDPMALLVRLSREETRFDERRAAYQAERELWEKRRSTKCRHCGRMTNLR